MKLEENRGPPADVEKIVPALSCRDLHRYLGAGDARVHALKGISLELLAGKAYAIVGPSGCGKSTLLYALGLLDRPDSGTVRIGGRDFSQAGDEIRTRARLESVGFIFQFHFLLAEFTALENVMLPMQRCGKFPKDEIRERSSALLTRVGLGKKLKRRANHLSGGEQQRVAVARALANSPEVILADEPTGNLDEANTRVIVDLLVELTRESQRTLAIVTHNPEVAKCCDVEFSMRDGRARSFG